MNDRFTLGFLAGVFGAFLMNVMNLFNYYVTHLAKLRYLDFAGYMVFGRLPQTAGEAVLSQGVQLGFSGVLGALFAEFLRWATHRNSWFKGVIWGNGAWFVLYAITVLYRIPVISTPDYSTAVLQHLSAMLYGVATALTYTWLAGRAETKGSKQKYHKYRIVPAPVMKKEHGKAQLVKTQEIIDRNGR